MALAAQEDPGDRLRSKEQALAAIRVEVTELEGRLAGLGRKAEGLAGELEATRLERSLQERRVAEARAAGEVAGARVAASEVRVAALGEELDRRRQALQDRLRGLYRLGSFGYLRLLLSIDRQGDPVAAVRLLRYLARQDSKAIESYQAVGRQLEDEQTALVAEAARVEEWQAQEEERRRELRALEGRLERLLARLEEERRSLEQEEERLRRQAARLSELLSALQVESADELDGRPLSEFKGVLDWPAEGPIRVRFGPVLDPRYKTRLPHNGVQIGLDAPQDIRAVFPGTVLFAGPFEGYGSMVVLHHPGRAFTIYSHLLELQVAKGRMVSLNQVLGRAADNLYFEIRIDNRPQDPAGWLR